jgi:hypothetical protein
MHSGVEIIHPLPLRLSLDVFHPCLLEEHYKDAYKVVGIEGNEVFYDHM